MGGTAAHERVGLERSPVQALGPGEGTESPR
jgi:hypothetical protein